jgi:hypothetical protein
MRAMQSTQVVPQAGGVACRQALVAAIILDCDLCSLTRQVLRSEVRPNTLYTDVFHLCSPVLDDDESAD